MKIIDFDAKFFEYARKWLAGHPGLTEEQIDDSYNQMMQDWLQEPADWLDGAKPCEYFDQFQDAQQLIDLMKAYSAKNVNLPEPLYSRIVEMGEACAPLLKHVLQDAANPEALRAEAMGMLRDMGSRIADDYLIDVLCGSEESGEICDMAADVLSARGAEIVPVLMDAYPDAPHYAQTLILDICCNYPGDDRIYQRLMNRLRNEPEQRALYASYLAKLGDERALDTLRQMLDLYDLGYFDYIELRNAVEALGGDVGEERSFYGDPDFEALRNL